MYDEQVTAAVVAAAVDLAGILDVLMSYLVDYTSNWIDEVSSDQQLVELLIKNKQTLTSTLTYVHVGDCTSLMPNRYVLNPIINLLV